MKSTNTIMSLLFISSTVLAMGAAPASATNAMKESLANELYDTLITETEASLKESLADGSVFIDSRIEKYKRILNDLCSEYHDRSCPKIYFSNKVTYPLSPVASSLPNNVLQINLDGVSRAKDTEVKFIMAHEYGHLYLKHSRKRIVVMANYVIDHSIVMTEPEAILGGSFLFDDVLAFHHKAEREADAFAFAYIKKKGLHFDCLGMFQRLMAGQVASKERHDSPRERCAANPTLKAR